MQANPGASKHDVALHLNSLRDPERKHTGFAMPSIKILFIIWAIGFSIAMVAALYYTGYMPTNVQQSVNVFEEIFRSSAQIFIYNIHG